MSSENIYIPQEEKDELSSKSKKKSNPKNGSENEGVVNKKKLHLFANFDKEKNKKIRGAVFILLSIYLFFSCFSYLFTWKIDQDKILNTGFFEFIFSSDEIIISNWFGKVGAWLSHVLMYKSFGISSLLFSFILFVLGFKWLLEIRLFPIKKALVFSFSFLVWFSLFFGFFIDKIHYVGGSFGYFSNIWLITTFGKVGAFLFHLILLYILLVIQFNPDFKKLWDKYVLNKKPEILVNEDDNLILNNEEDDFVIVNTIKDDQIKEEIISETIDFDEEEEDLSSNSVNKLIQVDDDFEIEIPPQEKEISNTEFEVNIAKSESVLSSEETEDLREKFGDFDPTLELSGYMLPPIDLLKDFGHNQINIDKAELEANKNRIVETLLNYKIDIVKIKATVGPTVTLYEIVPAPGIRIAKIKNLEDDIALSLSALGIRIIAPIPGRGSIGIEVPNSKPDMVSMRSLIASEKFQNLDAELPIVVGKSITNEVYTLDLAKLPHLLVAGATGQGKSVGLNAILISLLYKKHPAQIKFVLVDPKKVELTLYNKIERHFLAKLPNQDEAIIVDTSKVVNTLNSLCIEMDSRYELLRNASVRNIVEYNNKFIARRLNPENGHRYLPYIVVLIDEFADLIMTAGKEIEFPIARLAQLARAIGIHLIVATQRPSVNVITGMIKANFPARISFRVLSKIDSKTILDSSGADQLIGKGDMLISNGSELKRLQCGFIDTPEVEAICDFIGNQRAFPETFLLPEYVGNDETSDKEVDLDEIDSMFVDAARIIVLHQQGSASLLQRKLKLGYNRAGRIIDQMEGFGIIGPFQGSKARDVLFVDEASLEEYLKTKGLI